MPRTPIPYVGRAFRPDTRRLGDLMAARRGILIDSRNAEADINRQMVSGIASAVGDTLGSIMQWKANEPQRKEAARQAEIRDRADRAGALLDEGLAENLPKDEIAYRMEQTGLGREAQGLRKEAKAERDSLIAQAFRATSAHADVFGKADETLAQIEKNPSLYPEMRSHLAGYANSIDPSGKLAESLPATITSGAEITELRGQLGGAIKSLREQANALKLVQDARAKAVGTIEYTEKMTKGVANVLLYAPTPEARQAAAENLIEDGIDADIVNGMLQADSATLMRAAGKTPSKESVSDADAFIRREYGDNPTAAQILEGNRRFSESRREPDTGRGTQNELRDLSRRTAADAWKQEQLTSAERDFERATAPYRERVDSVTGAVVPGREIPANILEAHNRRKAEIQNAYLTRLGLPTRTMGDLMNASAGQPLPQPHNAPAEARTMPNTPADRTTPSPLGSGTASAAPRRVPPKVNDIVTVRGQRVRVTRVLPDGRIEGVPVP